MENYLRIIHKDLYDQKGKRLSSRAFSGSNGISVICKMCVVQSGLGVCQHIQTYYNDPRITSDPPIFWEFSRQQLPKECVFEQKTTASGDVCHYNLKNIPPRQARRLIINTPIEDLKICDTENGVRSVCEDDLLPYCLSG